MTIKKKIPDGQLIVRPVTETESGLTALVNEEDLVSASRFANPLRRLQHLAARAALREIVPEAKISYNPQGGPELSAAGPYKYVGFSHCKGAAAAIVSGSPCAVDIEDSSRDFKRAASKFISEAERGLVKSSDTLLLPAVWCAKETLYKYAGIPGLDFIRDLRVTTFGMDGNSGRIKARIKRSGDITVHIGMAGCYIFTYISSPRPVHL